MIESKLERPGSEVFSQYGSISGYKNKPTAKRMNTEGQRVEGETSCFTQALKMCMDTAPIKQKAITGKNSIS